MRRLISNQIFGRELVPGIAARPAHAARSASAARLGLAVLVALAMAALLSASLAFAALPEERIVGPEDTTWSGFFPTSWTNASPQQAGITAVNPLGLDPATAEVRYSTNGAVTWTLWSNQGLATVAPDPNTVLFTATGLQMPDSQTLNLIEFRVRVTGGSYQTSGTYTVAVDTTAPAPPYAMQSFPDGWTSLNSFRETWSTPADLSGVVGAYYRLNSTPISPTDGTYVPSPNFIDGIVVPAEGTHSILVWLVDAAGNVDNENYRVDLGAFNFDATPPSVGVAVTGPSGANGWFLGPVTLTFAPSDATSGIQSWSWTLDDLPPSSSPVGAASGDAAHPLLLNAVDNAGNVMTPLTETIKIDGGAPVLTHTVAALPGPSGWYTAPISITFGLTDPVSGPDTVSWVLNADPPVVANDALVDTQGVNNLTAAGMDIAGNSSDQIALSLPLDSLAPVTTLTLDPPLPEPSGYFTMPVNGLLTADDTPPGMPPSAASGVAVTWMRLDQGPWQVAAPVLFEDGSHELAWFSADVAGNQEITSTAVITVDLLPPGAPLNALVAPAYWSPTNQFTVTWQNPVDTSGIAGAELFIGQGPPAPGSGQFYPDTTVIAGLAAPAEGSWPVWLSLVDGAGWRGAPVQIGELQFDATPPTVQSQLAGPAGLNGWYTGPVDASLTVHDAGSGPALLRYRLDDGIGRKPMPRRSLCRWPPRASTPCGTTARTGRASQPVSLSRPSASIPIRRPRRWPSSLAPPSGARSTSSR